MNRAPLTDADIAAALRSHLPPAGSALHGRIAEQIAETPQVRRRPWGLGLGALDLGARPRSLLLVALLGLLAAASVGLIVGALLRSPDPAPDLQGTDDADAFVLASYQRIPELPALRLVLRERTDGVLDYIYHYDGVGALREDYGDTITTLLRRGMTASWDHSAGQRFWVVSEHGDEQPLSRLQGMIRAGPVDCPSGWESLGETELIGRPTRHVRCITDRPPGPGLDRQLWIDIATGLALRSSVGDAPDGGLEQVPTTTIEVAELEFAPQAADLFVMDGESISEEEYLCLTENRCASPAPSASVIPTMPFVSPPPAPDPGGPPADLDAFVAEVLGRYDDPEPVDMVIALPPDRTRTTRWQRDGLGNYRSVLTSGTPGVDDVIWLTADGRTYETDPRPDGRVWRDWGAGRRYGTNPPILGLPTACGIGWTYVGTDLVLDRPAVHVACGLQEFWIDGEWMLVTRAHDHDPMLGDAPGAGLSQAVSVTFGPLPEELFAAPPPATVWSSR